MHTSSDQNATHIATRLATLNDLASLAILFNAYRQFYQQADDLPLAARFIRERMERQESIIFVAENAEYELLGFCQLYPTFCSVVAAPIYTLYDLFVQPNTRKSGAGRALLLAAEQLAQQNNFARMDLTTAKTNQTAQRLYESLGWRRDDVFYAYNKAISN
ncbi:MAG: GNAT family N-acetyltransferase [Pseudomonadota bacterium]